MNGSSCRRWRHCMFIVVPFVHRNTSSSNFSSNLVHDHVNGHLVGCTVGHYNIRVPTDEGAAQNVERARAHEHTVSEVNNARPVGGLRTRKPITKYTTTSKSRRGILFAHRVHASGCERARTFSSAGNTRRSLVSRIVHIAPGPSQHSVRVL